MIINYCSSVPCVFIFGLYNKLLRKRNHIRMTSLTAKAKEKFYKRGKERKNVRDLILPISELKISLNFVKLLRKTIY